MYMWSWLHQEVWAYSEWNAPYQQESIYWWQCSVSVSFCPLDVAIVEDSHCWSSTLVFFTPWKELEKPSFQMVLCWSMSTAFIHDRWRIMDFYVGYRYYNPHGTDRNNTYNNNNCNKACVLKRGCGDVSSLRPTDSSNGGGCYHSWVAKTETCNLGFNIQCSE